MALQPSTSTIASLAIGVPAATVISWLFNQFSGIAVPPEVQTAFGALVSAFVGYFFIGGKHEDVADSSTSPPAA